MTIITNINIPDDVVLKMIAHGKRIAEHNRCKSWNKNIVIVSGNISDIIEQGISPLSIPDPSAMNGACWSSHPINRHIYIRHTYDVYATVDTLCHELAHAFTNPKVTHSYSWRSLYLLFYATLPRISGIFLDQKNFFRQIQFVRCAYEPRGHTPVSRHMAAMYRMQEWYIKNVEAKM